MKEKRKTHLPLTPRPKENPAKSLERHNTQPTTDPTRKHTDLPDTAKTTGAASAEWSGPQTQVRRASRHPQRPGFTIIELTAMESRGASVVREMRRGGTGMRERSTTVRRSRGNAAAMQRRPGYIVDGKTPTRGGLVHPNEEMGESHGHTLPSWHSFGLIPPLAMQTTVSNSVPLSCFPPCRTFFFLACFLSRVRKVAGGEFGQGGGTFLLGRECGIRCTVLR